MNAGLDIILLLVVVVFLISKLRSVLGEIPEENVQKTPPPIPGNIIELDKKNEEEQVKDLSPIDQVFKQISDYKKTTFTKEDFLKGAQKAFEIIVTSFANGDKDALKNLTDERIFNNFSKVIDDRKEKKQTVECQFVGFEQVEITQATLEKSQANITVKFVSEQVNLLKDEDGNILQGDEKFVETVTDLWTFSKDIATQSPVWTLISTKNV